MRLLPNGNIWLYKEANASWNSPLAVAFILYLLIECHSRVQLKAKWYHLVSHWNQVTHFLRHVPILSYQQNMFHSDSARVKLKNKQSLHIHLRLWVVFDINKQLRIPFHLTRITSSLAWSLDTYPLTKTIDGTCNSLMGVGVHWFCQMEPTGYWKQYSVFMEVFAEG